jgi:ABC-type Mn2+/Zn2+ transport system ATPase subunit
MNNLAYAAEQYHAFGVNVLPIMNGKVPAIKWDNLQTEKQSSEEIASYDWTHSTGVGIVSGVNGFVCIDIDHIKNASVVSIVLKELGLTEQYMWQVKSGSGEGFHIWIRVSEALPFKKGVVWGTSKDGSFDHLEIRWKECQTLVPPSLHISGKQYEWVNGVPINEPAMVSIGALLEAFEAVAFLKADDPSKEKPTIRKTEYVDLLMHGVDEGKRNDSITSFAGHLRKVGIEYGEALGWLKLWNNTFATPLIVDEVETSVNSIYSYPSSDIVIRDGMEMNLMDTPIMNDLVEGIIGERSLNFLAGEEGAGKSLLAMNLALAIATGQPKFLEYPIKKHGKVLYLNNELSFQVFVKRFQDMRRVLFHEGVARLNNFLTLESMKPLNEAWDDLCKLIVREQPILVVLDCLYWAHDKKENDSSEMKEIMRMFVELRDKFGIAVLVVHHTKKGSRFEGMHNDNMRGSSVFAGATDTVMMMRRSSTDESKRLFKPTKLRNGNDDYRKVRLLGLNTHNLWFGDEGEVNEEDHIAQQPGTARQRTETKIDFKALFDKDVKLKRSEIVKRWKVAKDSERTIDRYLSLAVDDGILEKIGHGEYALAGSDDGDEKEAKTEEIPPTSAEPIAA